MTLTNKPTNKSDMLAAFPEAVPKIIGEPTIRELIRVLRHLMLCSQTQAYDLSNTNLLFVCVPPEIFSNYDPNPYPEAPADPGPMPVFVAGEDVSTASNRRSLWEVMDMRHKNVKTMNTALGDRFLSLIDEVYKTEFLEHRISNPEMAFRDMFAWFLERYGETDENDHEDNKKRMEADWNLQDGWHKLERQIEEGIMFTVFTGYAMPDYDIVDVGVRVIMRTGLFTQEYKQWHARVQTDKTWRHFKQVWKTQIDLVKRTTKNAGSFGMGMNALQTSTISDLDTEYDNSVVTFANAHNKTQESINSLTQTNAQMQAALPSIQQQLEQVNQMQAMLCQQINAMTSAPPPAWQQQQYQQQHQGGNGGTRRNGRRNNRNGGGGNNWQQRNNSNNQGGRPYNCRIYEGETYCWTHGHDTGPHHTSGSCRTPLNGHQRQAHSRNTMGGNPANAHRTVNPSAIGRVGKSPPKATQQWNAPQQQQQQFGGAAQHQQWQPAPMAMPQQQYAGFAQQQQVPMMAPPTSPAIPAYLQGQPTFHGNMMQGRFM